MPIDARSDMREYGSVAEMMANYARIRRGFLPIMRQRPPAIEPEPTPEPEPVEPPISISKAIRLSDLRETVRKPTIVPRADQSRVRYIQRLVSIWFNLSINELIGGCRRREVCRPRQIAIALSKEMTILSYPAIGRLFGGLDHTTVLHAVKRVRELCAEDAAIAVDVAQLKLEILAAESE